MTPKKVEGPSPPSAVVRYRKWLLIPVVPVLLFMAMIVAAIVMRYLPAWAALPLTVLWLVALGHAASQRRVAWVVAIAVCPLTLLFYGGFSALQTDRSSIEHEPSPPRRDRPAKRRIAGAPTAG